MSNRAIYWTVGGVIAALLVTMLVSYNYSRPSDLAVQKAEQLVTAYGEAGLPTPVSVDTVARTLGEDGGTVCVTAGTHFQDGYLKTRLGVGGEFYFRPTILDRDVLAGYLLVAEIYCPDKVPSVKALIDELLVVQANR